MSQHRITEQQSAGQAPPVSVDVSRRGDPRRRHLVCTHIGALLLAAALVLMSVAGAAAYWTTTSSLTATTVLPDPLPLSFAPGTPTAELSPGDDANVAIVADNPNAFFLRISSLTLAQGTPFAVDAAHSACDVSVLSFTTQSNVGRGWSVPPKVAATDGTLTINLPASLHMSAAAANACQGATFTVRVTAAA